MGPRIESGSNRQSLIIVSIIVIALAGDFWGHKHIFIERLESRRQLWT